MKLVDVDHKTPTSLAGCEQLCLATAGCVVIVFHGKDKHCHTLSGTVTHDAYEASLKKDSERETCLLIV
jgi:hypothetical protein